MYYADDIIRHISTERMLERYINVEEFIQYCKTCKNYNRKWTCPEYDFSPIDIWRKYDNLLVIGRKIMYNRKVRKRTFSEEMLGEIIHESLIKERASLDKILTEMEIKTPESLALFAGSCTLCKECTKIYGDPCRHPDKIRYSIESLGGNVALLTEELLDTPLEWANDGKLPEYFTLICGLLY